MYTVEEAAKILKVTPQYVRKLINNNKLKYKIEEGIKKLILKISIILSLPMIL